MPLRSVLPHDYFSTSGELSQAGPNDTRYLQTEQEDGTGPDPELFLRWIPRIDLPKGASVRALVVDDSRAMRAILRHFLEQLGFEVFEAGHGKEGLERLTQLGEVDLAMVDWNMPEMNGLDFVRAVRAEDGNTDLRLMMVTTETELDRVSEALEAGANEYVMKPFTKAVLAEKLVILGMTQF